MNVRNKFVFLFLASSSLVHAHDFDCRFLYTQTTPSAGPWVAHAGTLDITTPGALYYRLGRGLAGGTVLRVVPTDAAAKTYLKKTYRSQKQRDDDATLLEVLGQTYPDARSPFRIPKVTKYGEYDLEMEETPGRDLHSLLVDPAISEGIKTKLRETYGQKLRELGIFLKNGPGLNRIKFSDPYRDYFGDDKLDGTKVLESTFPHGDRNISILIKSDNIIVHWVGGENPFVMTLIDPY